MGRTQEEHAADSITRLCHTVNKVVGVSNEELFNVGGHDPFNNCHFQPSWDYTALIESNLLRVKKIMGTDVVFPTEELIEKAFKLRKNYIPQNI